MSAARTCPHCVAEDLLEVGYHSTMGRTSIAPPMPRRRDPRGQLDRGVEVVGLEDEVAADRLLRLGERAVGDQRLAVLHAHGRRRLGRRSSTPGVTPGVWLIAM